MKLESLMQALHPVTQTDNFPITVRHLQALLFLATQAEPIDQGEARKRLGYHGPCMSRSVILWGSSDSPSVCAMIGIGAGVVRAIYSISAPPYFSSVIGVKSST